MINVANIIHSPSFETDITIIRTHGGHMEKSTYVPNEVVLTFRGIVVNPKNSKEVQQTPQGDRATGFIRIYLDGNTPVYTTRNRAENHNNISDIYVENYGGTYEVRYRITNVYNRATWGYYAADAVRLGGS